MGEQSDKSSRKKILFGLVVLFISVFLLFFVNACRKKTAVITEKTTEPPKEQFAKADEVILHSTLAGRWYQDLRKQQFPGAVKCQKSI